MSFSPTTESPGSLRSVNAALLEQAVYGTKREVGLHSEGLDDVRDVCGWSILKIPEDRCLRGRQSPFPQHQDFRLLEIPDESLDGAFDELGAGLHAGSPHDLVDL